MGDEGSEGYFDKQITLQNLHRRMHSIGGITLAHECVAPSTPTEKAILAKNYVPKPTPHHRMNVHILKTVGAFPSL